MNAVLLLLLVCSLVLNGGFETPRQGLSEGARMVAAGTDGTYGTDHPVGATGAASRSPGSASYRMAPPFQLEDQHGRTHSLRFPGDKASILAFGDRQGSEQIEGWIRPLYQRYGKRIDIFGVADVSAVPSWLRGIVRRMFRGRLDYPVMLDWSGEVSRSYGYGGGEANIFLVDRRGRIVLVETGAADAAGLERIYRALDELPRKE